MKSYKFLSVLRNSRRAVFEFPDLVKILNKSEGYTKVFINRLVKKGLLFRLEKGKYFIESNPFLVASNVVFPSYISFLSALSYHKLTTQIPNTYFVVSLKQRKEIRCNNTSIKFVKFQKHRFFGFKREILNNKFLFVAEVEKAIIDSLYLPKYCPIQETFFALTHSNLDLDKTLNYALRMRSDALLKRLGYLLELKGVDISTRIKKGLTGNFVKLNPFSPSTGVKNRKWKLIINEVLE